MLTPTLESGWIKIIELGIGLRVLKMEGVVTNVKMKIQGNKKRWKLQREKLEKYVSQTSLEIDLVQNYWKIKEKFRKKKTGKKVFIIKILNQQAEFVKERNYMVGIRF